MIDDQILLKNQFSIFWPHHYQGLDVVGVPENSRPRPPSVWGTPDSGKLSTSDIRDNSGVELRRTSGVVNILATRGTVRVSH